MRTVPMLRSRNWSTMMAVMPSTERDVGVISLVSLSTTLREEVICWRCYTTLTTTLVT